MMKRSLKFIFLILIPSLGFASEPSFEYPELSVVPRASERIVSEAAIERQQNWQNHLPYLFPASMTFLTGLTLLSSGTKSDVNVYNEGAKYAPWVGMGVGLAWWGVTLGILNRMDVYSDAVTEVSKLPSGTQREQLLRERRAEEAINRAGALAARLKWFSVASNLMASGFMIGSSKEKSFSLYMAIGSAVASFTPILFQHRWEVNESIHRDYKKRIYAPVVGAALMQDPSGNAFLPGLSLAFQF